MTPEQMMTGINGPVEALRKATRLDIAARLLAIVPRDGDYKVNIMNLNNLTDDWARAWALAQADRLMKENEAMP